jgi:hypothetical protein
MTFLERATEFVSLLRQIQENTAVASGIRNFPNKMAERRDDRVVDGGGLENH